MDVALNEVVSVIFDADVEPGAIEVVVSGVNVAKQNKNFLIYHKGISTRDYVNSIKETNSKLLLSNN